MLKCFSVYKSNYIDKHIPIVIINLQLGKIPITKNEAAKTFGGMTPIEKINVTDKAGNVIGFTYPKRAAGLIKKGRARYINENTIYLACPAENTEDETMSDININKDMGEVIENAKTCAVPQIPVNTKSENEMPTLSYILERIEGIANDSKYIHEALSQLSELKTAGPGDICGQAKADAIAHVVDAREETNRKLLAFYEMLYKDVHCAVKAQKRIPEQLLDIIGVEEDSEARLDMFHDLCIFFGESDK